MDAARGDVAAWSSPAWRRLATAWMDARLTATGRTRTGPVEQPRIRPWATVLTAPTTGGRVWLKAAAPATAPEVGLYRVLRRVAPDRVLAPLADDLERAWILLPDGGESVGERLAGDPLVPALVDELADAFTCYGRLQRDLAAHLPDVLAAGLPDMRPAVLPRRFDQALGLAADHVRRRGGPADRAVLRRVAALRPAVASWAERLVAGPGPASVDHNDLHPRNILGGGGRTIRFVDWGDSVVAHPFTSMLMALGAVGRGLGVGADDPRMVRLRDAYLVPFADLAPHAELVETLELACRLAAVARALTWERAARAARRADRVDPVVDRAPFACLAALLDPGHLAAV